MIVPKYWAESRLQHRDKDRQITLRRFGWSDASEADAQSSADARVQAALERVLAGEKLPARDPKIPYNGAAGVPIREEIVSTHGDTVITRNSYGARCLNTPYVLFADIDYPEDAPMRLSLLIFVVLAALAVIGGWMGESLVLGLVLGVLALVLASTVSKFVFRIRQAAVGGAELAALKRVAGFLDKHPDWNLRLYRTPAGMRVAATHRLFDPAEPAVAAFFGALAVDPIYARMCLNQNCFRARVSAKPWRIGIQHHLRPRPGVWPVAAERLPARNAWIAEYEKVASAFAACSFMESRGSGKTHLDAQAVLELHDKLCAATTASPIA